jgi:hypothetical protein
MATRIFMKERPNIYLALVHYPIKNKRGEEVTTSVTNLDIHDIARTCKTYGLKRYFIVTPIEKQKELLSRILGHWESDKGSIYNPDRSDALSIVQGVDNINQAIETITSKEGVSPLVAATAAQMPDPSGKEIDLINRAILDKRPILLLFGTGWGLTATILERAHYRLFPLEGLSDEGYNHLSVRSAVAIYCDRLGQGL